MEHATPPEGRIVCEQRGHILLIGIDRPAKRNGFTPPMLRALSDAYTRLDDDPALRVGLLHALGAHFTAGLDLPSFAPLMQRGIMATGGATLRMAERAGSGNALLHLLTADIFDSAEALRLNFVQKVVPAGTQLDEALRIADAIAAQAPLAVVATRQNVRKTVEVGPLAAAAEFIDVQRRLANSEDAAEGVRAFVERRAARFSGR
jgi:enoyl-CoA hydratase